MGLCGTGQLFLLQLDGVGWVLLALCPLAFPGRCLCTSVMCGADVSMTPWLIDTSGENCLITRMTLDPWSTGLDEKGNMRSCVFSHKTQNIYT